MIKHHVCGRRRLRLIALQARPMPLSGVCLSVRPSVTFVHSVETNKHIFKCFPPLGRHTVLVFPHQSSWRYSDGNPHNGGVECRCGRRKSRFSTSIWLHRVQCCQRCDRLVLVECRVCQHLSAVDYVYNSKRSTSFISVDVCTPKRTEQNWFVRMVNWSRSN